MSEAIKNMLAAIGVLTLIFVVWMIVRIVREDKYDETPDLWTDDEWEKIKITTGNKPAKKKVTKKK